MGAERIQSMGMADVDFKRRGIDRQVQAGGAWSRRQFLQAAGFGMLTLPAVGWLRPMFAQGAGTEVAADHFVPVDKGLSPEWVQALSARGRKEVYRGQELETVAMPIGGVCAGQVYLTGDGRLAEWKIFNQRNFSGYGATNYQAGRKPDLSLDQGAALWIESPQGRMVRTIDQRGFEEVTFCGRYPIATVRYRDRGVPVEVELEAFSPFIPLNAEDSALPATILHYTVRNRSSLPLRVTLAGWLENAVNRHSGQELAGVRFNEIQTGNGATTVLCRAKSAAVKAARREPVVFADFEGEDYGAWTVEGEAFGKGPAHGTLDKQQPVSGFLGKGLVNTYLGGDDRLQGKLISPEFTIERDFINLLVGGGAHTGKTCVNLVVDGKVVRTAKGQNQEKLAWKSWNVRDLAGRRARIEIVDAESGGWGHINVDQIEFSDATRSGYAGKVEDQEDHGTMGLSVLGDEGIVSSRAVPDGPAVEGLFLEGRLAEAGPIERPFGAMLRGAVGRQFELAPGAEVSVVLIASWCFPRRRYEGRFTGHFYANRFGDAAQVARYVSIHAGRLMGQTRLWTETYYDSTLPYWFLDRVGSTLSILATGTCQWWKNGRFWAWEGVGCCHGTCAHVWNYEHAMARLFPRLERSVREMQDYNPETGFVAETGMVRFRGEGWGMWAADSQAGGIMKALREHQTSADDGFLRRNWAAIKKALEFMIGQDGNDDGFLEGRQHNTFDIDFYGPNPMIVSLYLGALRAGETMARRMGDAAFGERCRRIYETGRKNFLEKLFNGEYFIQIVDLTQHPDAQYADGCLSDQLFGQGWAHQVGLGYLVPAAVCRTTLESIWKYNWAPDVGPQNKAHPPERWFARPGEAGLFTCTWPKSRHMGKQSVRYRNEVWTGIEYQVAGHMAWEGMVTEALAICRGIHERYHPRKRNPYNEVECGDHYARALASWGVLIGLCGYEYDGPAGHIGFAPRLAPDDFKAAFTGAEGWGTLAQKRGGGVQTNRIVVRWGRLTIRSVAVELPGEGAAADVTIDAPEQRRPRIRREGRRVVITLDRPLTLEAGQELVVRTKV